MADSDSHQLSSSIFLASRGFPGDSGDKDGSKKTRSFADIAKKKIPKNSDVTKAFMEGYRADKDVAIQKENRLRITISRGKDDPKTFALTPVEWTKIILDVLKIKMSDMIGVDEAERANAKKDIMLAKDVNPIKYETDVPWGSFMISARGINQRLKKVIFRNVSLSVLDREILYLCSCYGTVKDNKVYYEPTNDFNSEIKGNIRYVLMELHQNVQFENYYWLGSPVQGSKDYRISVSHPNQEQQCSNCLKRANECEGGGRGKVCYQLDVPRARISMYNKYLEEEMGYISLKRRCAMEDAAMRNSEMGIMDVYDDNTEDDGEISPANTEMETIKAEIAQAKKDLEQVNEELKEARKEKMEEKNDSSNAEMEALQAEVSETKKILAGMTKEMEESKKAKQSEIEAAEEKNVGLQAEIADTKKILDNVRAELEETKKVKKQKKSDIEAAEDKNEELQAEIAETKEALDIMKAELEEAKKSKKKKYPDEALKAEIAVTKESLLKANAELKIAIREKRLDEKKMEFARKITTQKIAEDLKENKDPGENLVSVMGTLLSNDKIGYDLTTDSFTTENEEIIGDLVKTLKDEGLENDAISAVSKKILERVKAQSKSCFEQRARRLSISSVGSARSRPEDNDEIEPKAKKKQKQNDKPKTGVPKSRLAKPST